MSSGGSWVCFKKASGKTQSSARMITITKSECVLFQGPGLIFTKLIYGCKTQSNKISKYSHRRMLEIQ